MPDIGVTYCGIRLRSPIIVGSANITAEMENIRQCEENGAGAVVMKSLFEKEVCRTAPTPRFHLIRRRVDGERSFTLYSYEQASVWGPERYAAEVAAAKRAVSIPIIASINCYTPKGWDTYSRMMEDAGADILEVNVSCPHSSVAFSGVEVEKTMFDVADIVRTAVRIPMVIKVTPQLTSPLNVVYELEGRGANGVTLFNRFTGLEIDIEKEAPVMHGTYAGHGGPWALNLVLRWISAIRPHVGLNISASGGVSGPEDVIKCLLVGADTVQTCTAVIMEGYSVIPKLNDGLLEFMKRKGYSSIDEFRGKVNRRILTTEEVERAHLYQAEIDSKRCSACGRCKDVCSYFAVEVRGKVYSITDRCDGCGLCREVCPRGAIALVAR